MRSLRIAWLIALAILTNSGRTTNAEPSGRDASIAPGFGPPPQFRLYRLRVDLAGSFVVPSGTTDMQLKSLVWLFREKVRARQFRDIGITQPTSKHWGKTDYVQGMLLVYRVEKCANEAFSDTAGPCGFGEHDDAYYQWGTLGDDPGHGIDPNKDEAGIRLPSGDMQKVFDYTDGWRR